MPDSRVLSCKLDATHTDAATALGLAKGTEAINISRQRLIEDEVQLLEDIWLPATRFKKLLDRDQASFGPLLYPLYESECGATIVHASETFFVRRAMKAGLQDQIVQRVESKAGIDVLGVYENGFRHVINSKGPIKVPADMKGMKIRVSGGKFRQDVFASLGAVPTKVSWGETFAAMQTGVVDGAEAAAYGFYGKKMYEVQKNLSLTNHVYTPSFLLGSQDFMKSLTEEQRKVFEEVGAEITEAAYDEAAQLETKYLEDMKSKLAVNETDGAAFQKATEGVSKSYIDKNGDDFLKIIDATRSAS
ncbi:TRAP transporter substrate-binding protein DctP [Pseudahrensia aquimaris]|uniref:TRAP transporter substrate-binding protein DctP n=1 Tax=Pseudahrensia aquimaris TaxID=744461 RepID=A0ABW3FBD6_9HYPH